MRSRRVPYPPSALFAFVGFVAIALYVAFPHVRTPVATGVALGSSAAVFAGVALHRPEPRGPWLAFGVALLLFVAGDGIRLFGSAEPLPTVPYVAGYAVMAVAMARLFRPRALGDTLGLVVDAAIGAAAFASLQSVIVLAPGIDDPRFTASTHWASLVYPVADMLLLVMLLCAWASGNRFSTYRLLLAACVLTLIGDQGYNIAFERHPVSLAIDACWLGAYVLIASAALNPSMRPLTGALELEERWAMRLRLGLLSGGLLLPPLLLGLLIQTQNHGAMQVVNVAAGVIALLAILRTVGLIRRADRLREAERRARAAAEVARAGLVAQNHRLTSMDRVKDAVIESVSHELRSPLASIRGHLKLVSDQAGDRLEEGERRSLQVIDRSSARLARMVEDILLVAQMRAGHFDVEAAPADLAALARECVETAGPAAAARRIELVLEAELDPALVSADPERICQVIDNLISNAVKFSDDGSAVTVSVRARGDLVELEVFDRGVGISLPDLTKLFQPFARGETASLRHVKGTGLGLYISKTIVEAHHGTIHLDSEAGQGTRARIVLPAGVGLEAAA